MIPQPCLETIKVMTPASRRKTFAKPRECNTACFCSFMAFLGHEICRRKAFDSRKPLPKRNEKHMPRPKGRLLEHPLISITYLLVGSGMVELNSPFLSLNSTWPMICLRVGTTNHKRLLDMNSPSFHDSPCFTTSRRQGRSICAIVNTPGSGIHSHNHTHIYIYIYTRIYIYIYTCMQACASSCFKGACSQTGFSSAHPGASPPRSAAPEARAATRAMRAMNLLPEGAPKEPAGRNGKKPTKRMSTNA